MKHRLLTCVFIFFACLTVVGQVNQVWWSKGRVLHVNPVAWIDSVTYGQFVDADTFLIVIDRASRRIVYDTVDVHVPGMVFHDTIRTTYTVYLNPGRRIGVFSVAKDRQVSFSQGNLQYIQNQNIWKFADQQYEYIGAGNIKDGKLANKIDLFGWSGDNTTAPFGVSTSTKAADYAGDFVDWGTNEINGEAPNAWRTLSIDEWMYLYHGRKNADKLFAMGTINGVTGMILLPDDWQLPMGVTCKLPTENGLLWDDNYNGGGYINTNTKIDYYQDNIYSLGQWREMENAGAVFLPAAGFRESANWSSESINPPSDFVGSYATSTLSDKSNYYFMRFIHREVRKYAHSLHRGRAVRLVHDTIVPPPAPCRTFEVNGVKFNMMCVEGGTFMMGSNEDTAPSNARPSHKVTLSDFYIGQTEVTEELWHAVMTPQTSVTSKLPIGHVTWEECQIFTQQLSQLTGLHFRLPTEAEWEYAARGGQKSRGYLYSGSNEPDYIGWLNNMSTGIQPVAQKMPNELGIYDMTGNSWEWCQDGGLRIYKDAVCNPMYDGVSTGHVIRGGSFRTVPERCSNIARSTYGSNKGDSHISMRLVMDAHDYVDLGLSVMWANTNVGATAPEEYGDYFAWGEVEPKDVYDWATYKWCDGTEQNITKYNAEDCLTTLLLEDDAAHANWGGEWRMPTKDEFQELIDYCTFEITQLNGVKGTWITSKINGNRIFVPYAGYYNHGNGGSADKNHLSQQRLWTSTKATRSTYAWNFYNQSNEGNTRRCGFPVRPVLPTERELLPPVVPGKRIGVFSVAKDKQVSFSQGNLQYVQSLNHWRFADNQLYYTGERHLRNGQIADTVMYFGWSAKDSPTPWGIGLETNVEKYKGEFLDWGVNEIQGDKANTWRTMSNDEWIYLFTERKNAAQLMGRGKVDDINGVILLPDDWVLPDGLSFAPIDDAVINHYTAEQWVKMESVGAVFIAAAGYFNNNLNPKMRFVGEYAYAASCNTLKDGVLQLYNAFTETTVSYSITGTSSTTLYYAFLRRLVHDTIVPPPAPCRTIEVNGVTFNMMCVDGEEYDYFVGQTEVTCSQWKAVMGSLPKGHTVGNKPIHSVTWGECQEFITKLNELTGLYFRFPTKDEWLYAAKGGQYKDDYLYSGSDDINQVGWYSDNSVGTGVHDVAKLKPNSLGIYDMTGNVWEWVESADGKHLYMGGSYAFKAESCLLSKTQGVASNDNHTGSIGIRLVLVINK